MQALTTFCSRPAVQIPIRTSQWPRAVTIPGQSQRHRSLHRRQLFQPHGHVARPQSTQPVCIELDRKHTISVCLRVDAEANLSRERGRGAGTKLEHQRIPPSIALGGNTALQNTVYANEQSYMIYPQFGAINYLSNFNHSTWESGKHRHREALFNGLTFSTSLNFSKCLTNADNLAYYERAGKARCSYDQQLAFGALVTYACLSAQASAG